MIFLNINSEYLFQLIYHFEFSIRLRIKYNNIYNLFIIQNIAVFKEKNYDSFKLKVIVYPTKSEIPESLKYN